MTAASTRLELVEHGTLRVGEGGFTARHFDELVKFNDRSGRRFFSIGHRAVTARSHVGYVEIGSLAIEILPKLARGDRRPAPAWQAALLEMLRAATGLRLAMPAPASQAAGRASLLELVATRFVAEVERLLHEGLARGYVGREENGPSFRGRLLVAQHLRENLVRADRFCVADQAYQADVAVNRILRAALDVLAALALSSTVRARAAGCAQAFPDVGALPAASDLFERLRPTRATARYQDALVLARLLLEQQAPRLRRGAAPVFAMLFEMDLLWERYVTWLLRRACPAGVQVSPQHSLPFWRVPGRATRSVRPDAVVRTGAGGVMVVDAKWKTPDAGPSMSDLQQMFVYNELLGARRAVLVYPASGGPDEVASGIYVSRDHRCETVHLQLFGAAGWNAAGMRRQVEALLVE